MSEENKGHAEENTQKENLPSFYETFNLNSKDKFKDLKELVSLLGDVKHDSTFDIESKIKQYEKDDDYKRIKRKYKALNTEMAKLKEKSNHESVIATYFEKCEKLMGENKEFFENYMSLKSGYKSSEQDREKFSKENQKLYNVRNTLENLFKDLKNKVQKEYDDHKVLVENEKEKRQELIDSLQEKIKDLQKNFESTSLEKLQKQKENELLKEKMEEVSKEIESKYQLFDSELKKKETDTNTQESQFLEKLSAIEQEAGSIDKFKEKLEEAKKKEGVVREKLDVYLHKCQEFQVAMTMSNNSFDKYRKDMEKMAAKVKKLDLNIMNTQTKCEKSDVGAVDQLNEFLKLKKDLATSKKQMEVLNNLMKSLAQKLQEKNDQINVLTSEPKEV